MRNGRAAWLTAVLPQPLPGRSRPGSRRSLQLRVQAPVKHCGRVLCRMYCLITGQCSEPASGEEDCTGVAGAPEETASQVHTRLSERPRPGHCEKQRSRALQGALSDAHNKQPAHAQSERPYWSRAGTPSSRIGHSQAGDKGVCYGCRYTPRSATPAAMHRHIKLADEEAMRQSEVARARAQRVQRETAVGGRVGGEFGGGHRASVPSIV